MYNEFHKWVDKLFDKLNLSASERKLSDFKSGLGKGDNLYRDREKLVRTYERLVAEVTRKIERLKGDMELVLKKIEAIDEKLKEKEA